MVSCAESDTTEMSPLSLVPQWLTGAFHGLEACHAAGLGGGD